MDKRTLLAVVLSALVLFAYYTWFPMKGPQPTEQQVQQTEKKQEVVTQVAKPASAPTEIPLKEGTPQNIPETRAPIKESLLKTNKANAQLSSQTGLPIFWKLNDYFQNANNKGPHINLLEGGKDNPPLQLFLFPGKETVLPYFEEAGKTSDNLQYQAVHKGLKLEQNVKSLSEDYGLEVKVKIKNLTPQPQAIQPGLRLLTQQRKKDNGAGFLNFLKQQDFITPLFYADQEVTRQHSLDEIGDYTEETGDISWSGLEGRYFVRAIIAETSTGTNQQAYGKTGAYIFSDFRYPKENLNPGSEKEYRFTLYLGPKNPTYLNAFEDVHLNEAIDYGCLRWWPALFYGYLNFLNLLSVIGVWPLLC